MIFELAVHPGLASAQVKARRVGPLAVHRHGETLRYQVSHIKSGRACMPRGVCCMTQALKLAKALQGLNWDFTLPRDEEHPKFPRKVQGEMVKARDIARKWLDDCDGCKQLASTVNRPFPDSTTDKED